MSVGWALCWELWARLRWVVGASAAYLVLVFLVGLALPERIVGTLGHLNPDVLWMLMPVMGALVMIITGLCRGEEGKWEDPGSALAPRLLVLPISAHALVGWSMLAGAVPMALLWPIVVLVGHWLTGEWLPLVWPGLLVGNVVAWGQTLFYVPFGVPYLRLWVIGLGWGGLVLACCLAAGWGVPEWILAVLLLGLVPAAFGLAVAGVKQARHGTGSARTRWQRLTSAASLAEPGPFASSFQALFWMEWRLHQGKFWLVAGIALITLLPVLYMTTRALEDGPLIEMVGLAPAVQTVGSSWLALAGLMWVPFLFGLIGGDGDWVNPKSNGLPGTFVLVRPVSTATLVAAKFWMCARGLLVGWVLIAAITLGWALPTGRWAEMSDRLVAHSGSGWTAVLVLIGGLIALYAIAWGHMVAGMWVGLSGRPWVLVAVMAVGIAMALGMGFLLDHVLTEPNFRPEVARSLPLVMAGALAFKVVLTAVVFRENVRQGLLSPWAVLLALGAWVLAAGGLFAGLAWLVPAEFVARTHLAEGVALVLPIARIGLAPLALEWNRHR